MDRIEGRDFAPSREEIGDPCASCVNDGKSSCLDKPCEGCPYETYQIEKERIEE